MKDLKYDNDMYEHNPFKKYGKIIKVSRIFV